MSHDENPLDELKAQFQQSQQAMDNPAEHADPSKQMDSARRIVENALHDAKVGKPESINDLVIQSLKRIREQSETDYIHFRGQFKPYGFTVNDLNRQTKIYKKSRKPSTEDDTSEGSATKAGMLIELVRQQGTLFHDADDESYISFRVAETNAENGEVEHEHLETCNLRSKGFKKWASYQFYRNHGTTPGDSALTEAIDTLSGIAQFEGEEQEVHIRYAQQDGIIYVNLANDRHQVIRIDTSGWSLVESQNVPVRFLSLNNMRPLPIPERDSDISILWGSLNFPDNELRYLILAYLLEAMRPDRPYPVLEIGGEQGSAKSTFQERLRELIDPNKVNLRSAPRGVEDIFVGTRSNHVISYENLSHLSNNIQDAFCTISTGGGDATRKLYTTTEEEAWEAKSPIMMNGISQLATRPDLADRTIAIELPLIKKYIEVDELKEEWQSNQPKILGALYDLLSKTLRELPHVRIDQPPRMADFAHLGQAMLNVLAVDESFTAIYQHNRDNVINRIIDASPVAQAILKMIKSDGFFQGTWGVLMDRLTNHMPTHYDKAAYPKSPRGLSDAVRRIAPALRIRAVDVMEQKDNTGKLKRFKDGYRISIEKIEQKTNHNSKTTVEL